MEFGIDTRNGAECAQRPRDPRARLCKPVTRVRHWNPSESNEVAGDEARYAEDDRERSTRAEGITFGATIKSHSTLTNISIPHTPRPRANSRFIDHQFSFPYAPVNRELNVNDRTGYKSVETRVTEANLYEDFAMNQLPNNWLDRFVYRLSADPTALGYSDR